MSRAVAVGLLLALTTAATAFPRERATPAWPTTPGPAVTAPLRIYLARHGETEWNRELRLQGQVDVVLNETGREQAGLLAERLRGVVLDRVYSSTLARSRETAEIARGAAPLESLDGLREQHVGAFSDLCLDGSEPAREAEYRRRSRGSADSLDGGESLVAFATRVRATAAEIVRRNAAGGTLLIVGHGGTNQHLLAALVGLSRAEAGSVHQANDDLYLIELAPGASPRWWQWVDPARLGAR